MWKILLKLKSNVKGFDRPSEPGIDSNPKLQISMREICKLVKFGFHQYRSAGNPASPRYWQACEDAAHARYSRLGPGALLRDTHSCLKASCQINCKEAKLIISDELMEKLWNG